MTNPKENIMINSRLSPQGTGNITTPNCTKPSTTQKWLFSILIGLLAFIVYSSESVGILNKILNFGTIPGNSKNSAFQRSLLVNLLLSIIFILMLRLLFW